MHQFNEALSASEKGTSIFIEVTAGSSRDSFPDGFNQWRNAIGCRVSAQAIRGKANRAIIALMADFFKVPKTHVRITAGAGSSLKRVLIEGKSPEEVSLLLNRDPA